MRFDKETLIKHRFWVLLVAFLPLMLFAAVFLWTVVDADVAESQRQIDQSKDQLKAKLATKLKGEKDLKLLDDRAGELEKRKLQLWEASWNAQQDLFTWPTVRDFDLPATLGTLAFGETMPDAARAAYHGTQVYRPQMDRLGGIFTEKRPVGLSNTETEFRSTLFRSSTSAVEDAWKERLRYVKNFYDAKITSSPSSEEVWLAQEDFWAQEALLQAIKKTNDDIGQMPGAGTTFRNASWQLDLEFVRKKTNDANYVYRGKLKNISTRRMPPGNHYFTIRPSRAASAAEVVLKINADALGVDQEWPLPETPIALGSDPVKAEIEVKQLYDSTEAPSRPPVRRIDRIELGAHSHRTVDALKVNPRFAPKETKAAAGKPVPPAPGPGPGPGPGPYPGMSPGPGGTANENRTENGLVRDRYSDITGQVRRLPFAMVVLVDQANVPELLTALANSKARVQITQVDWQHARHNTTRPADNVLPSGPEVPIRPPGPQPEGPQPTAEAVDENLVELTVYGIASLFERYTPPKTDGTPRPR